MRAAIYARYSSDHQSAASIDDQIRICQRLIDKNGWTSVETLLDAAQSGVNHLRPGYQALLEAGRNRAFDVVVAESIDRISRDQEHIASFYKQMRFKNIVVVTAAEGEINELHIGLKGTMSSLYLKDLAQKTHRGMEGRVQNGKSAGGLTYGYDVVRQIGPDGEPLTGDLTINDAEAEIVRRIYRDYANGLSARSIASALNQERIAGPRMPDWGASTINGNAKRGTGILNNELYVGRRVWNRQHFVKDPATGKRQARPNPPSEWITNEVPELRIVDDALWDAVKARQAETSNKVISAALQNVGAARRPRHLFSGMTTCAECGGGYTQIGKDHLGCSSARNKGTCANRRTIRRDVLERRVLDGLREQLLAPDLIAEFSRAYIEEFNQLGRDIRKERAKAERDLGSVKRQINHMLDLVCEGRRTEGTMDRLEELEADKRRLEAQLRAAPDAQPTMLHPNLSERYRSEVAKLTDALAAPETAAEARNIVRGLLSGIRLVPDGDGLAIELVGELAGLLALDPSRKKQSRAQGSACSLSMVAGAGFEPATFRL